MARVLGFIDVPGHERFVHTMLAGASGIDFALLVVAADDGIKPQTLEHLAIIDLLGIGRGLVALTKADTATPARLAELAGEIRAAIAGTLLEGADIVPVSALTGQGMAALRDRLIAAAGETVDRSAAARFRLAVDRVFTLAGVGLVVTGTVLSGVVRVGDQVVISPAGLSARVRSLHAQNHAAEVGRAGDRCALNLAGQDISKETVRRGDVVLDAELHAPTDRIDAQLRLLPGEAKPIGQWFPARLHHAAAETGARVVLLGDDPIQPGGCGHRSNWCWIGRLPPRCRIATSCGTCRRSAPSAVGALSICGRLPGGSGVGRSGRRSGTPWPLPTRWPPSPPCWPCRLSRGISWSSPGTALCRPRGRRRWPRNWGWCCWSPALPGWPFRRIAGGFSRRVCWRSLPPITQRIPTSRVSGGRGCGCCCNPGFPRQVFVDAACRKAALTGEVVLDGSFVRLTTHAVRLAPKDETAWAAIAPLLGGAERFRPPRVRDIAEAAARREPDIRQLLKLAGRLGWADEVAHDHFFLRPTVNEMVAIIADVAAHAEGGAFTAAQFRDRVANGRKVAIQILEFFDRHGVTLRRGDLRLVNKHRLDLFCPATASSGVADGRESSPVGRSDFKSEWGSEPVSGGFDSHSLPPMPSEGGA